MPTEDKFRTIVLSGLAPGGPESKTVISLIGEDGETLQSSPVKEDGSCVLAEEALAAAREVRVSPITLGVRAEHFHALLTTDEQIDVAALLAGHDPRFPSEAFGWPWWSSRPDTRPPEDEL